LGFAYSELNKYKASAEHFEKAMRLGMKDSRIRLNLAEVYEKSGMMKKAITEYENISPQTKEITAILADLYLKTKNYPKAITCYKKLLKLSPKTAGHTLILPMLMQHQGIQIWLFKII